MVLAIRWYSSTTVEFGLFDCMGVGTRRCYGVIVAAE